MGGNTEKEATRPGINYLRIQRNSVESSARAQVANYVINQMNWKFLSCSWNQLLQNATHFLLGTYLSAWRTTQESKETGSSCVRHHDHSFVTLVRVRSRCCITVRLKHSSAHLPSSLCTSPRVAQSISQFMRLMDRMCTVRRDKESDDEEERSSLLAGR